MSTCHCVLETGLTDMSDTRVDFHFSPARRHTRNDSYKAFETTITLQSSQSIRLSSGQEFSNKYHSRITKNPKVRIRQYFII